MGADTSGVDGIPASLTGDDVGGGSIEEADVGGVGVFSLGEAAGVDQPDCDTPEMSPRLSVAHLPPLGTGWDRGHHSRPLMRRVPPRMVTPPLLMPGSLT